MLCYCCCIHIPHNALCKMESHTTEESGTSPWRSRKYAALSDDEILELSVKKGLNRRDKLFLMEEIDQRGLHTAVEDTKYQAAKKRMFFD